MYLRLLTTLLLVVSLIMPLALRPPGTAFALQLTRPAGYGARFLPPDTPFYLAADIASDFDQVGLLDRLTGVSTGAPEASAFDQGLREQLGVDLNLTQLIEELRPNLAGEVFFAVPRPQDWRAMLDQSSTNQGGSIDPDCTDAFVLAGAAVRDLGALHQLLRKKHQELEGSGARTSSERIGSVEVVTLHGRSPELAIHAAVHESYLLLSTDRAGLVESITRPEGASLAAHGEFRQARARFQGRVLGFLYASLSNELLSWGGAGLVQNSPAQWVAAALRLAPDEIRVELSSSVDTSQLTPAGRAAYGQPSNPFRSASVSPPLSSVFVGMQKLNLVWQQVVESVWPDPEDYQDVHQAIMDEVGLDIDADVFGWMTGEAALVVTPTRGGESSMGVGVGVMFEAADPALVSGKLTKIANAIRKLSGPLGSVQLTRTEQIGGVTFERVPLFDSETLYVGMVDRWAVLTNAPSVAEDVVIASRGGPGLSAQPEFQRIRAIATDPVQYLGYLNIPRVVEITTGGVAASGGATPEDLAFLNPFMGVGLAVGSSESRIDGTFLVQLSMNALPAAPPSRAVPPVRSSKALSSVGVDWSHAGDTWPDGMPLTRRTMEQTPLARMLRSRLDVYGGRTVPPGGTLSRKESHLDLLTLGTESVVPTMDMLIRVGSDGTYSDDELQIYYDYARCGGTLLLLSDKQEPGESDPVAARFGIKTGGEIRGVELMDRYAAHPITANATPLGLAGGTGILSADAYTQILGSLNPDGYLDLNGNGQPDPDEPKGAPVFAIRYVGRGAVVFLGSAAFAHSPDHSVTRGIFQHFFPGTPWNEGVVKESEPSPE